VARDMVIPGGATPPARTDLRVAVLHTSLGRIGGSELQMLEFARHRPADGARFSLFYHGVPFPELEAFGNAFPPPGPGPLGRVFGYLRVLRRLRTYDRILFFHGVEPALLTAVSALHRERCTLYMAEPLRSLWEEEVTGKTDAISYPAMGATARQLYGPLLAGILERPRAIRWVRRQLRTADRASVRRVPRRAALTGFIARLMARVYALPAPPEVIYPFPPDGPPNPRFDRPDLPLTALCVGALLPYKDHATLLRAWGILQRAGAFPASELIIVGDGPLRKELEERCQQLGLTSVRFLGRLDDGGLREWYARAHVLVHPAMSESFGLTPVEAAQWGLPSVVSDSGGIVEFVENGVSGRTFPTGDPEALSTAIAELFEHPAERERLARAAYERASTRFSRSRGIGRLIELTLG
jgi:glycosyltransferase involved in cell wall biosynthesis